MSLHDLVQVLVRRSCGDPAEILLKMSLQQHLESWRCSTLVLVWKFFWDAPRKFLYDDLLRSSIYRRSILSRSFALPFDVLVRGSGMGSWWVDIALLLVPKQVPAAGITIMPTLMCYCSILSGWFWLRILVITCMYGYNQVISYCNFSKSAKFFNFLKVLATYLYELVTCMFCSLF